MTTAAGTVEVKAPLEQAKAAGLVVMGVRADGTKELIAIADGYRESSGSGAGLLRDCQRRGMRTPVLAVGGGALGIWNAVNEVSRLRVPAESGRRGPRPHGRGAAAKCRTGPGRRPFGRGRAPDSRRDPETSAKPDEPSRNQVLVVRDGSVVGYSTIRWWQERDDTWLYLHHGYLLPEHRDQGIGSAMLRWAEERIRQLVEKHGTARTAVIGANAMLSEQDATALLLSAGYRRVVSLVELELGDPQQLPEPGSELPAGYGRGRSGPAPNARLGGRSSIRVRTPVSLRNGPSRTLSNPYGSYDLYESEGFRRRDRGRCAGFVAADAVSDSGSGAAVSAGGAFWDVASADQQGGACRCRARVRADPVARCLTGVRVISGGLLQPRQRLPSRTVSGLLVPAPP